jgi:hypothetical protein
VKHLSGALGWATDLNYKYKTRLVQLARDESTLVENLTPDPETMGLKLGPYVKKLIVSII